MWHNHPTTLAACRDPGEIPPRPRPKKPAPATPRGDDLASIETTLWQAADQLRGTMDAAGYKHIVLGLLFLKYISDRFDAHRAVLAGIEGADLEDRDEYLAENVFWVPPAARWESIHAAARQPDLGQRIDSAMAAIEADNDALRGVLPKQFASPDLDRARLGNVVDLVSQIGLGTDAAVKGDVLGRVYEYFLGKFAAAEGKLGGEFYTPSGVVRLLVEMLEPDKGRVYDPCCGSGGMFVGSERFVTAHGGRRDQISVYGQESNATTWRLAKMNLAIRGIEADLGPRHADSFTEDQHPDLRADFILANPPFNIKNWGGERLREDVRWRYGAPPTGNANYAWIQHMVHHLAPTGVAGFVLANGSMSAGGAEGEIRRALVEGDLVDCLVALPGQLFLTTGIPVCLWFVSKGRKGDPERGLRDRRGETLFIDARKLGTMVSRTQLELTADDTARIAGTYHAWRGEEAAGPYADTAGFCRSATRDEIAANGWVLTPGRYVGTGDADADAGGSDAEIAALIATLREQTARAAELDAVIAERLGGLETQE